MLETTLARMRLGHCGLASHLYRFGLRWSPLCQCGIPETVTHYLMQCPNHAAQRLIFRGALAGLQVEWNLPNLLGGGQYCCATQRFVAELMRQYLVGTGKFGEI